MTSQVLDALNQPLVVFLLLVGTGGFLIVGELQTMARETRRKAGEGGAPERATSVGSLGTMRRHRVGLLVLAALILVSAFGTASASFTSHVSVPANVRVAIPPTRPRRPTRRPTRPFSSRPC